MHASVRSMYLYNLDLHLDLDAVAYHITLHMYVCVHKYVQTDAQRCGFEDLLHGIRHVNSLARTDWRLGASYILAT